MEKQVFNNLTQDISHLQTIKVDDLAVLTEKFPWFHLPYMFIAKKLHSEHDPFFSEALKKAAIQAYDRETLFKLIERTPLHKADDIVNGTEKEEVEEQLAGISENVQEIVVEDIIQPDDNTVSEKEKTGEINDEPGSENILHESRAEDLSNDVSDKYNKLITNIIKEDIVSDVLNNNVEEIQKTQENADVISDAAPELPSENKEEPVSEIFETDRHFLTEGFQDTADNGHEEIEMFEENGSTEMNLIDEMASTNETGKGIDTDKEEQFFEFNLYELQMLRDAKDVSLDELVKEVTGVRGEKEKKRIDLTAEHTFAQWLQEYASSPVRRIKIREEQKPLKIESSVRALYVREFDEDDASSLARKSVQMNDALVTETYADILARQGKTQKAIEMLQKLSLKFPQKSVYFAGKIADLKK